MPKYEQPEIFTAAEYKKTYKRAPKAKREKKEERLQVQICDYIKLQYPHVIFMCDLASGMKLPPWIGALHKKMRSSRGLPDLFITREKNLFPGHSNGLFIELKQEKVRLKNGGLASSDHIKEQLAVIERLRRQGFTAEVCCGFDEAKKLIDNYMKNS